MELYSIGTVESLRAGKQEVMITSRFPLYNKEGVIRYFEYGGVYTRKEKQMRFNNEDIEAVL
ncbi:DUF4176 domain-containing protein [Enterococcus gilvus]|uniref:DUF4176 domain-containing protein n=1 Tax=Enterococcus gilvus TaxID=160453 RepID=UPI001C8C2351|nr:DUF4176 domain-containing protein [Enterococcus gilvus]MBX8935578.1 DUF4176 domain-containing protein [Enterococcus gilvus]